MSVFHPANATSDGWETPQIPQSHSPATNSCATDLIPRPSVPKSQVEVGWGCILSCMRTCCMGCISYVYSPLASSRLACHAIQHIQRCAARDALRAAYLRSACGARDAQSNKLVEDSAGRLRPTAAARMNGNSLLSKLDKRYGQEAGCSGAPARRRPPARRPTWKTLPRTLHSADT